MPLLVHLTDEKETASIIKNGIKIGKYRKGIYYMPVMPNFYISHQWLRELKRFKGNTFVGVYFKVSGSQKVFAGKFNEPHKNITLNEAIKEIQSVQDPLGYELIIDRKIEQKEVHKIQHLPQTIGWRYKPGSNGKKPCSCDYCQKGKIKASRIRKKYEQKEKPLQYAEILSKLQTENDQSKIDSLFDMIRKKRRSSDPNKLLFLLEKNSDLINQDLALILRKFRHKNTKNILLKLLEQNDDTTREYAADSLLELYGKEAEKLLSVIQDDSIKSALIDWQTKQETI